MELWAGDNIVRTPPFLRGGVGLPQNWQEGGDGRLSGGRGDAKKGGQDYKGGDQ